MDKLIDLIKYVLLGLVQGIAEILPISSSGHLIIIQTITDIKSDDLTVEIFLHIASLLALLIYFRKELIVLIKGFFNYLIHRKEESKKHFNWAIKIIIATIPAAIVGLLLEDIINDYFSSMLSVGILLLINASIIFYTSYAKGEKKVEEISYLSSLIIGVFQSIAVLPGLSRSGTTIAGGKTQKLDKEEASLFAFMLFIPVSVGAFIMKVDNLSEALSVNGILLTISFIIAFISTYLALKFIFTLIRQGKFIYFAYYSIVVGLFSVIYALINM